MSHIDAPAFTSQAILGSAPNRAARHGVFFNSNLPRHKEIQPTRPEIQQKPLKLTYRAAQPEKPRADVCAFMRRQIAQHASEGLRLTAILLREWARMGENCRCESMRRIEQLDAERRRLEAHLDWYANSPY